MVFVVSFCKAFVTISLIVITRSIELMGTNGGQQELMGTKGGLAGINGN